MKKIISFLIFSVLLVSCLQRRQITNVLPSNLSGFDKGATVLFIASDQCGFCLRDVPYNIELHKKYGDKANFISLYDNDSIKKELNYYSSKEIEWKKLYAAQDYIDKIWVNKLFPQVHLYVDGKHKKALVGSTEKNKKKLENFLQSL